MILNSGCAISKALLALSTGTLDQLWSCPAPSLQVRVLRPESYW